MSDVAVTVDKESVESIQRSLFRLVAWTNRDAETALLMAAWYVGHAAAEATKLSAKRRKILDNPSYDGSDRRRARFVVQTYRQNHIDLVPVKAIKVRGGTEQCRTARDARTCKKYMLVCIGCIGCKGRSQDRLTECTRKAGCDSIRTSRKALWRK